MIPNIPVKVGKGCTSDLQVITAKEEKESTANQRQGVQENRQLNRACNHYIHMFKSVAVWLVS